MAEAGPELTDGASILRLLQASDDLLLVTDLAGMIVHASRGWQRALGWPAADLKGRSALDLIHPDDSVAMREALADARQGADLARFANRCAIKGGGWRRVEWVCAVSLADGLIHASVRDVTEVSRAASHAAEIESISGVGTWEVDLDADTLFWSPITRALHGVSENDPPPVIEALRSFPPEALVQLQPALDTLMEKGTPYDLELPFIGMSQAPKAGLETGPATGPAPRAPAWVRITGAAELRAGRVARIYGTIEDITARRQDRARLQDFADIVELASDGIWVIGAEGQTRYANPRMAEMLGLPPDALAGQSLHDFTLAGEDALARLAAGPIHVDLGLRHATGADVWVSIAARPRFDALGRLASSILIVADVTERRAVQTAMVERARAAQNATVRLEATLAAMPDPVLELDASGRITGIHLARGARPHPTAQDAIGRLPEEILPPRGAQTLRAILAEADATGCAAGQVLRYRMPDGPRCFDISAAPRASGGYVVVLRDITAARAQDREVRRLGEVARITANPVIITDRRGRIGWVNPAFETLTGWQLDEVRGHKPGSFLQFDGTDPDTVARIGRALRAREPVVAEILNRSRHGNEYWLKLEIQPRFDAEGRHIGFIAVQTDVTDLVAANRATAEAEARAQAARDQLIAAVEALEDGFAVYDSEDRLVLANERYRQLYAVSADAITQGARFEDILRTGLLRGQYAEARGREEAWLAERLEAHADCTPHQQTLGNGAVLRIVEKLTTDGGRVGLRVDITELSHARDRARAARADADRARAQLTAAIEALQDGFVLFDAADRIVVANQRYLDLHPLTADVIVPGTKFEDILRLSLARGEVVEAQPNPEAWLAQRLALHRTPGPPFVQRLRNGRILRIHEMPTPDGGRVGLQVDVTELLEARERAEAASAAKSSFLATMSHEIRTPLNGVLGMAEILADTPLADDQRDMLETLRTSGWSLLALLNDILDLARVEAGKMTLETAPFSLADVLARVGALHGASAQGKGIALEMQTAPEGWRLGDETRVMQVLHNLVGNAVKFTPSGRVTVMVERFDAQGIAFSVADSGIGMSEDQLDRVFEAFEQAEAGTARRFGGTGLGMAIVRRLVEMMGGTIVLDSRLGQGTTVRVSLPLPTVAAPGQLPPHASRRTTFNVAGPVTGPLPCRGPGDISGQDLGQSSELVPVEVPAPLSAPRSATLPGQAHPAADPRRETSAHPMARFQRGPQLEPRPVPQSDPRPDARPDARTLPETAATAQPPAVAHALAHEHAQAAAQTGATSEGCTQHGPAVAARAPADGAVPISKVGAATGATPSTTPPAATMRAVDVAADATTPHSKSAAAKPGTAATANTQTPLPSDHTPPAPDQSVLQGLRLLVAEDNATNRRILDLMLSRLGIATTFAEDGAQALAAWRAGPFDLLILDISMPVMDGLEALGAMIAHSNATNRSPPLAIAATANVMTDQVAQYLAAGFADTLPKPFRRDHLIATLLRVVDLPVG